jgi:hypothetical protein
MMNELLTRTAYHEAGHAIAAFESGVLLLSVTIEPDELSSGNMALAPSTPLARDVELDPANREAQGDKHRRLGEGERRTDPEGRVS